MSAKPQPEPRSTGSNPVFDNIVSAVGHERAARLFGDFTLDTRERVERIGHACAVGDVATIQTEAHNLRGTAGHFGFQDLSDLAGEIEAACRSGDAAQACNLARRVQKTAEAALEGAAEYGHPDGEDAGKSHI